MTPVVTPVGTPGEFEAVAWSWVDHLRHRGTRPWLDWSAALDRQPDHDPEHAGQHAGPAARSLPGATQLEVVRRLAGRPAAATVAFTALADLVLGRAAPGRGPDDLPLVRPGHDCDDAPTRFGPPPVDPGALPADELVRVLVGTIAELLARSPDTPPRRRPGRARAARRGRPAGFPASSLADFPVVGAPRLAPAVRSALAAAGHAPVEPPTAAVVLAEPVDRLLGQTWALRLQRGGIATWPRYVERWARQDALPGPADLAGAAARWAQRVGPERVHVVIAGPGPDPAALARRVTGHVLGLSLVDTAGPRRLTPGQAELVRQVNRVLRGRVPDDRHRRLLRLLVPRVADDPAGHQVSVPPRNHGWAQRTADRAIETLCTAGYRVHGDPGALTVASPHVPDPEAWDLLDVALDTCLTLAGDPATAVVPSAATRGADR